MLPAAFIVAEFVGGHWTPAQGGLSPTPSAARRSHAWYLRVWLPYEQRLDEEQKAPYIAAADQFEDSCANDLDIMGRFRVARVERLMRIGPDGPEGPRASDYDPEPPPGVHEQQLREQGVIQPDENAPLPKEREEEHQRFMRLDEADAERRKKRHDGA